MQMLADLWEVPDHRDEPLARVSGMGTRKSNPLDARHFVHLSEKLREVACRVVRSLVVIHDLAEQLDLATSVLDGVPHFRKDVRLCPHPFVSARVRNDTERAVVVAPFDDRDVRLYRVGTSGDPQRKADIVHGADIDFCKRRRRRLVDENGQHLQPLRTHHNIDDMTVRGLEQPSSLLLRNASGNRDDRAMSHLVGEHTELTETRVQLLLRALADAARIDHDDVCLAFVVGRLVARLVQKAGHALGIVDVHLTAECLDQIFLGHN